MKRKDTSSVSNKKSSHSSVVTNLNTLIQDDHDVLVIGDGNFSYSYDLALQRCSKTYERIKGGNIIATSYDSKQSLFLKYGEEVHLHLNLLSKMATTVKIFHNVDATDLKRTLKDLLKPNLQLFDRIVFNFPLVPLTKTLKDRKNAIIKSIGTHNNSIIVILGKGRENYQIVNNKKIQYSDIETIENYLDENNN